jgi:hypothetical protein
VANVTGVRGITDEPVYWKPIINEPDGCFVAVLVQRAIAEGKKPFDDMIRVGGYQAFTQIDITKPEQDELFLWPQIDALQNIVDAYPEAYYIHTRHQEPSGHVSVLDSWNHYLKRLRMTGLLTRFAAAGQSANKTDYENCVILVEEVTR